MQRLASATKTSRRKGIIALFGLLLIIMLGVGALLFFWGFLPVTSLKWEDPQLSSEQVLEEICNRRYAQYPERYWPFPLFSPDEDYYLDLSRPRFRLAKELQVYRTSDERLIGSYSYRDLTVRCWAEDSSGIYISDTIPGGWGIGIYRGHTKIEPVKKLLVP